MRTRPTRCLPVVLTILVWLSAASAHAQMVPWVVFEDSQSASACDVINTAYAELVLLDSTGELVIVSGVDGILTGTFVDWDLSVLYQGSPEGWIGFAEDGDGYRTLWWMSFDGRVYEVDDSTGEPFETYLYPSDFFDVPCDACEYWDDRDDCEDSAYDTDFDGVPNGDDLCPNTPFDEIADVDGCSCSNFDDDDDGISDCYDLCPFTPIFETADDDGCSCSNFDDDDDGINDCYDLCPFTSMLEAADDDGCSCSQLYGDLDSDLDGVDDCYDLCPTTSFGQTVDGTGCPMTDLMPVTINFCGATGAATLSMMLCGLFALGLTRRRRG